jgi:hypothetical protein
MEALKGNGTPINTQDKRFGCYLACRPTLMPGKKHHPGLKKENNRNSEFKIFLDSAHLSFSLADFS